jgi:hypothetical protein
MTLSPVAAAARGWRRWRLVRWTIRPRTLPPVCGSDDRATHAGRGGVRPVAASRCRASDDPLRCIRNGNAAAGGWAVYRRGLDGSTATELAAGLPRDSSLSPDTTQIDSMAVANVYIHERCGPPRLQADPCRESAHEAAALRFPHRPAQLPLALATPEAVGSACPAGAWRCELTACPVRALVQTWLSSRFHAIRRGFHCSPLPRARTRSSRRAAGVSVE